MNYLIYQITNPTGKKYIGYTNNFNRRMSEHKSEAINKNHTWALHRSIRKYGFDNHIKEIIFNNLSKEEAQNKEEYLIDFYELTNSKIGLNSRKGGQGGNIIDWNSEYGKIVREKSTKKIKNNYLLRWSTKKNEIVKLIKTKTIEEICIILSVKKTALTNYMRQENIKCPVKKRLDYEKIYQDYLNYKKSGMTNRQIIKEKNISNGTICRIKAFYKNQNINYEK